MNQTQRANNSIKNDCLATLYGKYNYEEGLIDQIYESKTQRFTIQPSSSKALISNNHFQDSDSDVEENQWTSNEFMADLNVEYHERALLANQKGSIRGLEGLVQLGNPWTNPKKHVLLVENLNSGNHQKDYKGKYKGLKAEMVVLTKRIDDMTKGNSEKGKKEKEKSEKGLIAESFDWDDESVSSDDERSTKIRAFMPIAEDEPSVGKADARSGQWVDITMKRVHRLLSMTNGDERKHILDYTHVDLYYVEDQRKNLINKFNLLKQEISSHNKVTLDQLLSEQVLGNIVKALGGKGRRKEKISSKEVVFTKADESSSVLAPEITSDLESECDSQEPLPPLPKLIGAAPSGTSESLISLSDLTLNMADLTLDTPDPKKTRPSVKVSPAYVIKKKTIRSPVGPKPCSDKKADSSIKKLLLTLMEEIKGLKRQIEIPLGTPPPSSQPSSSKASKQKTWFGPCKHCGFRNNLSDDFYLIPKCSTCGSTDHLTKEHLEHAIVQKTLNSSCSRHMTGIKQYLHRYSKESGPKVVFGDDSSEDTEGKMEKLNEVRIKELRSDNGTEFKNHKLEEFCDKKGISQNFSSSCTPEQNGVAERRNKTLIEAAKTMLNRRSPDISYFHVFGCLVHIHNHRDHLGKFDEKADDGFFLGYSPVAKAFRVFNIKRQEMEETVHVTFSDDDEAIFQSNIEGDAINFNEYRSFPDDEFLEPMSEVTQCPGNIEYFPYIPAYENITPSESPIL
ncbi:retrovirus-related pol polyprotein from transposon TNT 1-94 [Tanacetum coccineum]